MFAISPKRSKRHMEKRQRNTGIIFFGKKGCCKMSQSVPFQVFPLEIQLGIILRQPFLNSVYYYFSLYHSSVSMPNSALEYGFAFRLLRRQTVSSCCSKFHPSGRSSAYQSLLVSPPIITGNLKWTALHHLPSGSASGNSSTLSSSS